jgi:hypothetical protein
MRQVVERDVGWAALAAFVAVLVLAIYDQWAWSRRPAAISGRRELVLNAGAIALDGGTVTVIGSAAGTHGGSDGR